MYILKKLDRLDIVLGITSGELHQNNSTERRPTMESKFTPGPWRVVFPKGSNGFYYVGPVSDTSGRTATCYTANLEDDTESKANANLIAAAPDMYEALSLVLDSFSLEKTEHFELKRICKSAMAKAEGGQNV